MIRTFFMVIGFSVGALATSQMEYKNTHTSKQIKKMDHSHTKYKAAKRHFKTKKEFQHKSKKNLTHKPTKHNRHTNNRYDNGYNYRADDRTTRQRGYRHPNRGWLLAYRYDRASFYDREGFYYGYFNRHGYYFENVFYRYDRHYTFRDRVKGRGLFDHRYYMPENARYYGFCSSRQHPREYARAY